MCYSNLPFRAFKVSPNTTDALASLMTKRPLSSIITPPSQYSVSIQDGSSNGDGPQRKRLKQSRNSVQFMPRVGMRCYFQQDPPQERHQESATKKDEVAENRIRTRALSKQWRRENPHATARDTIRSEIEGESLRGLDYIACASVGHRRLRVKEEAIRAALEEQREQLVRNILNACSSSAAVDASEICKVENRAKIQAMKMDTGRLAKVYAAKARGALAYAEEVAREDAAVAAEILAEDLKEVVPSPRVHVGPTNQSMAEVLFAMRAMKTLARHRGLNDELIKSLLLKTLFRQRRVAAMQA